MIAGLRGIIEEIGADSLLVNVGGVVYQVFTTTSTLAGVSYPGVPVNLHTHLQVRDDSLTLFGFASREELRMFQLLVTVSGVGPRSALALLSAMPVDQLSVAIASEDTDRLTSVSGVGKRTAARIALDLKGKVGQVDAAAFTSTGSGTASQLLAALTGLGYSSSEATAAVRSVPNLASMGLEEGLREALRVMSAVK